MRMTLSGTTFWKRITAMGIGGWFLLGGALVLSWAQSGTPSGNAVQNPSAPSSSPKTPPPDNAQKGAQQAVTPPSSAQDESNGDSASKAVEQVRARLESVLEQLKAAQAPSPTPASSLSPDSPEVISTQKQALLKLHGQFSLPYQTKTANSSSALPPSVLPIPSSSPLIVPIVPSNPPSGEGFNNSHSQNTGAPPPASSSLPTTSNPFSLPSSNTPSLSPNLFPSKKGADSASQENKDRSLFFLQNEAVKRLDKVWSDTCIETIFSIRFQCTLNNLTGDVKLICQSVFNNQYSQIKNNQYFRIIDTITTDEKIKGEIKALVRETCLKALQPLSVIYDIVTSLRPFEDPSASGKTYNDIFSEIDSAQGILKENIEKLKRILSEIPDSHTSKVSCSLLSMVDQKQREWFHQHTPLFSSCDLNVKAGAQDSSGQNQPADTNLQPDYIDLIITSLLKILPHSSIDGSAWVVTTLNNSACSDVLQSGDGFLLTPLFSTLEGKLSGDQKSIQSLGFSQEKKEETDLQIKMQKIIDDIAHQGNKIYISDLKKLTKKFSSDLSLYQGYSNQRQLALYALNQKVEEQKLNSEGQNPCVHKQWCYECAGLLAKTVLDQADFMGITLDPRDPGLTTLRGLADAYSKNSFSKENLFRWADTLLNQVQMSNPGLGFRLVSGLYLLNTLACRYGNGNKENIADLNLTTCQESKTPIDHLVGCTMINPSQDITNSPTDFFCLVKEHEAWEEWKKDKKTCLREDDYAKCAISRSISPVCQAKNLFRCEYQPCNTFSFPDSLKTPIEKIFFPSYRLNDPSSFYQNPFPPQNEFGKVLAPITQKDAFKGLQGKVDSCFQTVKQDNTLISSWNTYSQNFLDRCLAFQKDRSKDSPTNDVIQSMKEECIKFFFYYFYMLIGFQQVTLSGLDIFFTFHKYFYTSLYPNKATLYDKPLSCPPKVIPA